MSPVARTRCSGIVLVAQRIDRHLQEWARRTSTVAVTERAWAHAFSFCARWPRRRDRGRQGVHSKDLLELHTGDQVPCDGRIELENRTEIDESLLTGESDPV